jgi:hypothetical protein
VISVLLAALGLLALLCVARWLCVCVLDLLLVSPRRAEDFELREFIAWKREQEGRNS